MPIVIDDSIETKDQTSGFAQLNTAKEITPLFFHKRLTGSGLKKGLFNEDNNTYDDVVATTNNELGSLNQEKIDNEMVHSDTLDYMSSTEGKGPYYATFARVLTTPVLPQLFETSDEVFRVPSNTALFSLMNYKRWTEIHNQDGYTTRVSGVVQSVQLFSKEVKTASATQPVKQKIAVDPSLFVTVVTYKNTVKDDAEVLIGGGTPTDDAISMTVFRLPLDAYNQVGEHELTAKLAEHFEKSNLTTLDRTRHGVLTVDNLVDTFVQEVKDICVSDLLSSQAKTAYFQIEDQIDTALTALVRYADLHQLHPDVDTIHKHVADKLSITVQSMDEIGQLDTALLPTDFLSRVYDIINRSSLSDDNKNRIIHNSLRLLLSQRLDELNTVKKAGQLYQFNPKDDAVTAKYKNSTNYSNQQKKIILTTEPLTIGQAGAGSGKSHTIGGRINYMEEQGEDLSTALALSFTNVAANNIKDRFPNIRSQTLANMFNKIYELTYPQQKLSQPSTVANAIMMLNLKSNYFVNKGFGTDEFVQYAKTFANVLNNLDQTGYKKVNIQLVTKTLALMIQKNIEATEVILDAVEQTTLELQPIIIHHHLMYSHAQLTVPKEYQDLNYIITDESQDISTFEYILLLELAIHHKAQLLIVGDGSQTLYEFRNSDPKYMNALEASGVFANHKLDINFRSKPEILTFANQILQVIEANDVAKIQLKSQQYALPTEKSFENAITIQDVKQNGGSIKEYSEALTENVASSKKFQKWFLDKMRNDEQVCVLGWTRKEVLDTKEAIDELLKKNNLNIESKNIMSNNERPMTIVSRTLRNIHASLIALDPTHTAFKKNVKTLVDNSIMTKHAKASPKKQKFFKDFTNQQLNEVMNTHQFKVMQQDCQNGYIKSLAVIGFLVKETIRKEQTHNNMKQYLQKDLEPVDYSNEKLLFSTIHGAKGLEFDHVLLLFNESKRGSTSQESLRMLFVALSRAKDSEYIMNVSTKGKTVVSDTLSSMFKTPMNTAYMRGLNWIKDETAKQKTAQP